MTGNFVKNLIEKKISLLFHLSGVVFSSLIHIFGDFILAKAWVSTLSTKHSHKPVLVVRLVSNGDRTKQGQGVRAFDCNNGKECDT